MPKPTFDETVDKAAQAIYAKTPTAGSVRWELLPRNVQHEIREVAKTAITVALVDLRDLIANGVSE